MLLRMQRFFLSACLLAFSVGSSAQTTCSTLEQQKAASEAAQIRQLIHKPTPDGEDAREVPAAIQPGLLKLKEALARTTRAVMACHDTSVAPTVIEHEVARLLHANPPQPLAGSDTRNNDPRYPEALDQTYGSNLRVTVARPAPSLLSVQFDFYLACDGEAMLEIFEARDSRWTEKIRWSAPGYKEIKDAFGEPFEMEMLPGRTPGAWRVAVLHGTPQCVSVWTAFAVDILEPSASPQEPRVVRHLDHNFNLEKGVEMTSKGDVLTIKAEVGASDSGQLVRPGIFRYRLSGDSLQRIGPIATNGRYFADEWLQMPWEEAARFSDPASLVTLKKVHDRIQKEDDGMGGAYGPVRSCSDNPKHFQVAFGEDVSSYFQILENGNGYTMLVADSAHADPRCTGPDLMAKR